MYRKFDILELQKKIAIESASAGSCVITEKLGEGSYNKPFRLTMANRKAVIARIPSTLFLQIRPRQDELKG